MLGEDPEGTSRILRPTDTSREAGCRQPVASRRKANRPRRADDMADRRAIRRVCAGYSRTFDAKAGSRDRAPGFVANGDCDPMSSAYSSLLDGYFRSAAHHLPGSAHGFLFQPTTSSRRRARSSRSPTVPMIAVYAAAGAHGPTNCSKTGASPPTCVGPVPTCR